MKSKLLYLFTIILFVSCSLDDDDAAHFKIETLTIKEAIVPSEFNYGSRYNITIVYDLPSGCHSFYELFYQYEDTARIVAVNSLVNENIDCTDALIEQEFTFIVNVVQHEDYIFKFWKGTDGNGENIFEEIIVPVNE